MTERDARRKRRRGSCSYIKNICYNKNICRSIPKLDEMWRIQSVCSFELKNISQKPFNVTNRAALLLNYNVWKFLDRFTSAIFAPMLFPELYFCESSTIRARIILPRAPDGRISPSRALRGLLSSTVSNLPLARPAPKGSRARGGIINYRIMFPRGVPF